MMRYEFCPKSIRLLHICGQDFKQLALTISLEATITDGTPWFTCNVDFFAEETLEMMQVYRDERMGKTQIEE